MDLIEKIASICHEANRAYCKTLGDESQKSWEAAEQWQRDSMIAGVKFALTNPNAPPSAQHEAWLATKQKEGWVYGPVKSTSLRQHPCIVPYSELPGSQRMKDNLFRAIVKVFAGMDR